MATESPDIQTSDDATATAPARRRPGRPRGFDRTTALEAAMLVFWKYGFDGTSYPDLTAATGMSKPTLYATFGDKVNLFREAAVAYMARTADVYEGVLNLPTAREAVQAFLRLSCGLETVPGVPLVCFLVQGAMTGSADTEALRHELTVLRRDATTKMAVRFERAQREGELPAASSPVVMAEFFAAVATGLSVQAASGTPAEQLRGAMNMAMSQWPGQ